MKTSIFLLCLLALSCCLTSAEATFDQIQDLIKLKKSFLRQLMGDFGSNKQDVGTISNSAAFSNGASVSDSSAVNYLPPPPPPTPVRISPTIRPSPPILPPPPPQQFINFPPQIVYVLVQPAPAPQPIVQPQVYAAPPQASSNSYLPPQSIGYVEQQQVQEVVTQAPYVEQPFKNYQQSIEENQSGETTLSNLNQGYLPPHPNQNQQYQSSSEVIDNIVENVRQSGFSDVQTLSAAQPIQTISLPNQRAARSNDNYQIYQIDLNQL